MTYPTDPVAPTAREIAALTARLRDFGGHRRDGDPVRDAVDRAAFLADKRELLDRIAASGTVQPTYEGDDADETITPREASERLTALGFAPAAAEAIVASYLDEASRQIGVPVHQWGLDQHDVEAIADRGSATDQRVPAQRNAAQVDEERSEQFARWHADDSTSDGDGMAAAAEVRER